MSAREIKAHRQSLLDRYGHVRLSLGTVPVYSSVMDQFAELTLPNGRDRYAYICHDTDTYLSQSENITPPVDLIDNIIYNITMVPPQIAIDTNVVFAAQRSRRGASAKLMSLIGTALFAIHVSVPLALEYEEVLLRQRASLALTQEDVTHLVDALCALAHHQEVYFLWRPYLRDAADELVLELAVAAGCDYIVTYNKSDFAGAERFGIEVIDPKALLERIGELK